MAKQKQKFYVVWVGREQGIYTDWDSCKKQVEGFEGAQYKSYNNIEDAQKAFLTGAGKNLYNKYNAQITPIANLHHEIIYPSLSVDAACSGNPGEMEYQGVDTQTKQRIFHQGPFSEATNNIGEFLALVHALAYMQKNGYTYPIYSDSVTAQSWVRQKKCKTKLAETPENKTLFDLIHRAEQWLHTHTYTNKIIKWDTDHWGEIPADFGRK